MKLKTTYFRSETKTTPSFQMPKDMDDALTALSKAVGMSRAALVRDILEQVLKKEIEKGTIEYPNNED